MMSLKKKKWSLTMYCVLVGTVIAVLTSATLGQWTAFALAMIGVFGAADVADKKLNNGSYDVKTDGDSG